jgi:hypothetical protein
VSEAELTSAAISALANLLIAGAAIAAAIAAFMGLSTWKAQNVWVADKELARNILIMMYKHKDAIANVRHPVIFSNETEAALVGVEVPKNEEEKRFLETAKVYERRWATVSEVRSQAYPLLLEVEAIWGKSERDLFQQIWELEAELFVVIKGYVRSINPKNSKAERDAASKGLSRRRDIMYDSLEADDDVFKKDYAAAMRRLEDFLRPKLGRKP